MARSSSRIPTIPANRVIDAHKHPELARVQERPSMPYNIALVSVEQSIRLTLWFMSACTPPFGGGQLQTYDYDRAPETVIWPLFGQRVGSTGGIIEYWFDAHGALVQRTVIQKKVVKRFTQVDLNSMPHHLRVAVLHKLQERRRMIHESWSTPATPKLIPVR